MEDRKKKIIILTSIMIAILIVAILLGIILASIKNKDKTIPVNSNQEINNTVETENIIENNEIENEINNTVNEIVPEENEEATIEQNQPVTDPEQEVDKEIIEKQESDREKAIRIVKEHYGENDSVYFSYEGIENEKYKVSVRDSNTTRTIREYYIDIKNETFEILQ